MRVAKSAAPAKRALTVLKFFIEMSVKCAIYTEVLAELRLAELDQILHINP
jgi:hypothetical protein